MIDPNVARQGLEVVVNAEVYSGLPEFTENEQTVTPDTLSFVSVRENFEMFGKVYAARPGTVLEMLSEPRDVDGIEAIRVRIKGTEKEGEVYWCELQASCDQYVPI